ncbi:hypothetical protein [Nocardiopsis sp. CNT312]|uniref:hypothetical protein n=1 Tax=Nocardiopsis sp. CNT312 TaxID=1137268 RepID=UPI0009E00690|nr:hypothetical protein [Nocardiopsis sp. CNT312]
MTHQGYDTPKGRPPLAVWPCAPHLPHPGTRPGVGEVAVPDRLASRLVAEYTRPGEAVADLTGTGGRLAELAREQDRTGQAASRAAYDQGEKVTVFGAGWAHLTVTVLPALEQEWRGRERRTRARVAFAALLTRPGGIVAAITPVAHRARGAVVDPAPGVVRAAECAGLVYVQHVIALTVPVCEEGLGGPAPVRDEDPDPDLDLDPDVGEALPVSAARAAATITSPAHLNVSVFRLPGRGYRSRPERGAVEVVA